MHWEPILAPADGEVEREAGALPPFAESLLRDAPPAAAKAFAREVPFLVVVALVAAFLVRTFVFQAFFIPSPSMGCAECPVHTLEIDDKIVVSKLSYRLHEPRRGDVIVFECPPAATCTSSPKSSNIAVRAVRFIGERVGLVPPSTEDYIKRVIGLAGETVEARDGIVYVDGRILREPYLNPAVTTRDFGPQTVPPRSLWVMGDNRQNSGDSRVFGPIRRDSVVGRTVLRLLPPRRTAFL
ncbi:MAG TPA: signal peptidase I [Acidimicrobiales bacterium]|nr:signal peptidase I [Acidimicrobiales bacterium]